MRLIGRFWRGRTGGGNSFPAGTPSGVGQLVHGFPRSARAAGCAPSRGFRSRAAGVALMAAGLALALLAVAVRGETEFSPGQQAVAVLATLGVGVMMFGAGWLARVESEGDGRR